MVTSAPDPRTWAVGDRMTAARANTEIRDALDFLLAPPSCRASNAAISVTSGSTWVLMTLDTESHDWTPDPMHDTGSNNSRIYCQVTGLYVVDFTVEFSSPGSGPSGVRQVNLRSNAAGSSSGGTSIKLYTFAASQDTAQGTTATGSITLKRTAGDYFEVFARQTQGSTLTATPSMGVTWLGS